MTRLFRLGQCVFVADYVTGYGETVFPSGRVVPSYPEDTESYRTTARSLGYSDDFAGCAQMAREHEALHSLLAAAMGLPWSPVLYERSEGRIGREPEHYYEEGAVLALQGMLNLPDFRPLPPLEWRGVDVRELRREALRVLR